MDNQEAIRLMRNLPTMCEFTDAYGEPIDSDAYYEAVDIAISALHAQDVPDTNVGDMVSGQSAIDEWKNDFRGYVNALNLLRDDYKGIMEYIDELPSAQPERAEYIPDTKAVRAKRDCVDLGERVTATFYDQEHEEWTQQTVTIADVLDSVCDKYTILPSVQPEQDREFIKLMVRNSNSRPYYSIIYLELDDNGVGHDFEGYSSYSLDVISDYLKKYFMPSAQPYTDEEIQKMQDLEQAQLDKAYELGRQSAQPERLTDDDFETIRIHLNAYKEKLCNQQRWKEADEYQRIIDRFMAFASAQPEISQEYAKAVFAWLLDYQIKVAELKGRYTPYEVLSWVANDWRKES